MRGIYDITQSEDRFGNLIGDILFYSVSSQKKYHINIYEYSYKHNNPETDKPLIAITQEDMINANIKIINQFFGPDKDTDNIYPISSSGLYLTYAGNIYLPDFNTDNIPITFRMRLYIENKDKQIKFIGGYLKYFKTFKYKLKFNNPDIDLKDKEVIEYFYNEIDTFNNIHCNKFYGNNTIITIKEILLPKIINAGLALNMSYDEILEDVNLINKRVDNDISSSNKIYQYMIFESKDGQKILSDIKKDLMSLKALLESKIGVPINISFIFVGNDSLIMRRISV